MGHTDRVPLAFYLFLTPEKETSESLFCLIRPKNGSLLSFRLEPVFLPCFALGFRSILSTRDI